MPQANSIDLEAAGDLAHRVGEHLAVLGGERARDLLAVLASTSSRIRNKSSARRAERRSRATPAKAAFAAATAASTSSTEAKSTSPVCSPVAGLKTGPLRPDVPVDALAADPVVDRLHCRRCLDHLGHRPLLELPQQPSAYDCADGRRRVEPAEGERVVADDRQYVIHSWSVQSAIARSRSPAPRGATSGTTTGKRYLDFASQLVNVSIGHQHPKLVEAIKEQADRLCTIGPTMANDKRSELARLLAEVTPGDLNRTFFTNGGAEANENAIKLARWVTRAPEGRSPATAPTTARPPARSR